VSVVPLIVATRSSGILISGKIIKEMPGSVASGIPYISVEIAAYHKDRRWQHVPTVCLHIYMRPDGITAH